MATIESTVPRSRRALLAAAAGGLAALAAQAIGRPLPARAEGEVIHVGDEFTTATSVTAIKNTANDAGVFRAENTHSGTAVRGISATGDAVAGFSGGGRSGVFGQSGVAGGYGVYGHSSATGNTGYLGGVSGVKGMSSTGDGVWGVAHAREKSGVYGVHDKDGAGVFGRNTWLGSWGYLGAFAGVYGVSEVGYGVGGVSNTIGAYFSCPKSTGLALLADGKVKIDKRCGTATIVGGTKSREVKPSLGLTTQSKVLCTLQGNPGGATTIQRVAVNPSTGAFTVYLTANAAGNVKFAWLVLD